MLIIIFYKITYGARIERVHFLELKRLPGLVPLPELLDDVGGIQVHILHAAGEILVYHQTLLEVGDPADVKLRNSYHS
jgi:hypothetical protein